MEHFTKEHKRGGPIVLGPKIKAHSNINLLAKLFKRDRGSIITSFRYYKLDLKNYDHVVAFIVSKLNVIQNKHTELTKYKPKKK